MKVFGLILIMQLSPSGVTVSGLSELVEGGCPSPLIIQQMAIALAEAFEGNPLSFHVTCLQYNGDIKNPSVEFSKKLGEQL